MYQSLLVFWHHHSVSRFILRPLAYGYLALFLFSLFFADAIIYLPPFPGYFDDHRILKIPTPDGVSLSARYFANAPARYTILYSHGSAEDLAGAAGMAQSLHDAGFAVFMYDYHGYGNSGGKPSETALYLDIDAAYRYMTRTLRVDPSRIIVFGYSLGGGPSVDLASRMPVAGLILMSTFTTPYRSVTRIPLLPFDKFHNDRKIARVRCPVLIMHGREDMINPFSQAELLYAAAKAPKRYLWVDGAGHFDVTTHNAEKYRRAMSDFSALLK